MVEQVRVTCLYELFCLFKSLGDIILFSFCFMDAKIEDNFTSILLFAEMSGWFVDGNGIARSRS